MLSQTKEKAQRFSGQSCGVVRLVWNKNQEHSYYCVSKIYPSLLWFQTNIMCALRRRHVSCQRVLPNSRKSWICLDSKLFTE